MNDSMQAIVAPDTVSDKSGDQAAGRSGWLHRRSIWIALILAGLILLLVSASLRPADELEAGLRELTGGKRFNLAAWEVQAVAEKLAGFVRPAAAGLPAAEGEAMVRGYLEMAQRAGRLEDEIERIYADPSQEQPDQATEGQRAELAGLREKLESQASVVEAVLETQVSQVVASAGLSTAGLTWPPPRLRFTEPPQLLVVSPRERIERLRSVDLVPDLDTAERASLEDAVADGFDLSAYVTGVGGYGTWPTMVVDRYGLPWTAETIAHEWIHNYLAFRPLGWAYLKGGDAVTINETVASIAGEELGRAVMAAYYPDLIPPPPSPQSELTNHLGHAETPAFDFGREMRTTRLVADRLLAHGLVEEAETYMEDRRQRFVDNGYRLRKLNQAYFAFHGSYATGPAAVDPIGPKLEALRERSSSLAEFLDTVSRMTSLADLDTALQQPEGP